jgi:hypothetical protein
VRTSQRQYGLRQKQGKILIISRLPGGAGDQAAELLAITLEKISKFESAHLGSKAISRAQSEDETVKLGSVPTQPDGSSHL